MYGVRVSSIKRWNRIYRTSRIYPGEKIVIWKRAEGIPVLARSKTTFQVGKTSFKAGENEIWYVVQPGDTLWDIARRYSVTLAQLSRWNKLDIHQPIHPGLKIRLVKGVCLNTSTKELPVEPVQD